MSGNRSMCAALEYGVVLLLLRWSRGLGPRMGRAISLRYYPIKGQPTASPMLDGGSPEEDLSGPVSDIFKIIYAWRTGDTRNKGKRGIRDA